MDELEARINACHEKGVDDDQAVQKATIAKKKKKSTTKQGNDNVILYTLSYKIGPRHVVKLRPDQDMSNNCNSGLPQVKENSGNF